MAIMGCALCRVRQDVALSPQDKYPVCHRHSNRVLVDWKQLELHPEDQWIGLILNQRYELIHPLGKGGFGSVYFAVQRGHIRYPVAIKLLTRKSPEYLDLFRDEMRVISRLKSPHTVRYLDSGTHRDEYGLDIPFMVMNFIEGETLAHRIIRDGALHPQDVIIMLRQLMNSLNEAHQQGIVHRDLKPLNLMINQKPSQPLQLVVLDFGVARILDEASREATQNRIMGTPYYLAPEALIEQQVSPSTDLFAATVIAYEALCCRSPFLNEELQGIEPYLRLRKLYRKKTKPIPLPEKFSREWKLFFECALSVDPRARFPDASSILIALDELERIERERKQNMASVSSDELKKTFECSFEEDEVTTFFKRHLAGESLDEETLQSLSDTGSSILETLRVIPPPLPELPFVQIPVLSVDQIVSHPVDRKQPKIEPEILSKINMHSMEPQEVVDPSPKKNESNQHLQTTQISKPKFLEVPPKTPTQPYYPKRSYSTSATQRYPVDHGRKVKGSEGLISAALILVQLALMVGLGALFAYIMIRYVLV